MTNYITSFEMTDYDHISNFMHIHRHRTFTISELREVLSSSNVNFVLDGINRVQSMLLCEKGFSYVQQSQRYVPVDKKCIKLIDDTPEELKTLSNGLIEKSLKLYKKMTKLKDPKKKGRLTSEDFEYGISYEDARSILPLCISTNIVVSMSGDKLIDLMCLFNTYPHIFKDLKDELRLNIPVELYQKLYSTTLTNMQINDIDIFDIYYSDILNELSEDNNVILLDAPEFYNFIAIGALASQNTKSPNEIFQSWLNDKNVDYVEKSEKLVHNVLSYGHEAILEQARTTYAMQCSLSTYHQVIRHRLQNIRRESLNNIIFNDGGDYIIPESIKNNKKIYKETLVLIDEYKTLFETQGKRFDSEYMTQFLLNCNVVRFVVTSNLRNDITIFKDRLCYTAQKEIRNLYLKKFESLYEMCPELVKRGLPPCVIDKKCKEGKLTCGHYDEVRENYKKII